MPRDPARGFAIDMPSALAAIEQHQPSVIFVTTPNNPTGGISTLDEIRTLLDAAPGVVIVDEAYAEFSEAPSAVDPVGRIPREARRVAHDE